MLDLDDADTGRADGHDIDLGGLALMGDREREIRQQDPFPVARKRDEPRLQPIEGLDFALVGGWAAMKEFDLHVGYGMGERGNSWMGRTELKGTSGRPVAPSGITLIVGSEKHVRFSICRRPPGERSEPRGVAKRLTPVASALSSLPALAS